jgi:AP-4 complex subunit epsilon-1
MLGHDASFGHIHALKFVQSPTLLEKRIGYLAVSLLLHKDHELIVLLINTLQKDLKSSNILEVSMALTAVTKVIGPEMIPAVLPIIANHLNHQKEIVKKKAVLALHHFHRCDPSSVSYLHQDFRNTLCDKDPGVMEASLNIFYDFARENGSSVKDLTASFVSVLKQVVERKLPRDFDYHGVPAPWIQLKILRILALLGVDDLRSSECMYEVISLCMGKADPGVSIGQAIIYECIRTVTAIYPNSTMIERCAKNVGRLLSSLSNNLKYLGKAHDTPHCLLHWLCVGFRYQCTKCHCDCEPQVCNGASAGCD